MSAERHRSEFGGQKSDIGGQRSKIRERNLLNRLTLQRFNASTV